MNEFETLTVDRLRDALRGHGADGSLLASFGLWCPWCGEDTYPTVRHECSVLVRPNLVGLSDFIGGCDAP